MISSCSGAPLAAAVAALWLSPAPHSPQQPPEAPATAAVATKPRPARSAALLALLDEQVEAMLRDDPVRASTRGERRFDADLPDASPEAVARRRAESLDRLQRLERIDAAERKSWSDDDRTDADLLRYELELGQLGWNYQPAQIALDNKEGVQISLPQMSDTIPFTDARSYDDYATRLENVPRLIDQTITQLRAGMAAKRVQAKPAMAGTIEQCESLATDAVLGHPEASSFYKPFLRPLPGIDVQPAAGRARAAIAAGIVPAYRKLAAFLREEYIPACRESIAASSGPDGIAFYDWQLRRHTTTGMTSEEIHQTGLREVARIREQMFLAIARTDFPPKNELRGDALFDAFVAYLRTDPRFYYTEAEDLLRGYRDIAKRVDAELPRFFGTLPRNPYGIREMPMIAAKMGPTAYYYAGSMKAGISGTFVANTYRLDQRPKYEMVALTLHEAAPGHHLQIALSQELADSAGEGGGCHKYRTMVWYNAFGEGWGLYAERLGMEMETAADPRATETASELGRGMYKDPYDDFGRLTYEMWRACRLVVDTGMHAKGWSRDQAIAFMKANTALSELNIEREIDRYIAWPGQACAYKIGELRLRALRAEAEQRLGPRFNIRAFHDNLLGAGVVPLPVVEERVGRWIERQK